MTSNPTTTKNAKRRKMQERSKKPDGGGVASSRDSCRGAERGGGIADPSPPPAVGMREEMARDESTGPMDWIGECVSIADQLEESVLDLEGLTHSRRLCARCGEAASASVARAAGQLKRSRDALRQHSRRYRQMLAELQLEGEKRGKERKEMEARSERREKEIRSAANREMLTMREKNLEVSKELAEVLWEAAALEQERDLLRDSLAMKEEDNRKETERLAEEIRGLELERDQLRVFLALKEDQLRAALITREEGCGRGGRLLLPWISS